MEYYYIIHLILNKLIIIELYRLDSSYFIYLFISFQKDNLFLLS